MNSEHVRTARRTFGPVALALVLIVPGCATGGGGSGSGGGSGDVITREQIETSSAQNAYNLIREFRPRWVQRSRNQNVSSTTTVADARGGGDTDAFPEGSQEFATVFYDGRRYGDIDSLSSFQPSQIEYIEYLNAREATTLYGTGYTAGVINLVPRSARDLAPGQ